MIILIAGASHTGKTYFAQKLLEKYQYPTLSIDHLKMGLIRSGQTALTPLSSDEELTAYLWPIVREMIKTALENGQNLIVEGCYIPFDWKEGFEKQELEQMEYHCLIMSENYIRNHFEDIKNYANVIENRLDDRWCTLESTLSDNRKMLALAQAHQAEYTLIEDAHPLAKPSPNKSETNLRRSKFYVCPQCGNILRGTAEAQIHCCGATLTALEPKEPDAHHKITVQTVEEEQFITVEHAMTKEHYISFMAYLTADRVQLVKFYPEGNAETRLCLRGHGDLYIYCNTHGLMKQTF